MLQTRIIPVLLLKGKGLYKGKKFKKHKYVGDPINTVKIFNDKEVDELILFDIEATNLGRSINFEYIEQVVSEAFMPVAYGGGIRTIKDAKKLFSLGVEKVVLNTQAIISPHFIQELVSVFGSQSIVFSLDVKKTILGKKVFAKSGSEKTKYIPEELALKMQDLGVGEIIVNDIDRDGTALGYDLTLIQNLTKKLSIPLVICGGAVNLNDFKEAIKNGAHACAAGSMFVFHGQHQAVLISYPRYDVIQKIFKEQ